MARQLTYTLLTAVACSQAPSKPIHNVASVAPAGLPCGVEQVWELSPYGEPNCEPNGSCWPGAVRSKVGTCTVGPSQAFDRYGGRERSTIFEGGVAILSSDAPPSAQVVVFDPRVPTPYGIRVGMTGADLERLFPDQEFRCEPDDVGWRGRLRCGVRENSECGAEDANWRLVIFEGDVPATVLDARALVRARRIVAIDLGPSCGES